MLTQPEEPLKEDFLFPMSNRLSYASSPESDTEMMTSPPHGGAAFEDDDPPSPGPAPPRRHHPRLVRSSSDPSVNTGDGVPGIPPYPAPPSYHRDRPVRASAPARRSGRPTLLFTLIRSKLTVFGGASVSRDFNGIDVFMVSEQLRLLFAE